MADRWMREALWTSYAFSRKAVVLILGSSVLLLGVGLIVLPGPAVVVIPAGLAILAIEFAWARRLLQRARDGADASLDALRSRRWSLSKLLCHLGLRSTPKAP